VPVESAGVPLREGLPGLAALRDRLPSGAPSAPDASRPETAAAAGPAAREARSTVYGRAPRLVVRRERKGHGGKTWTRVEGLMGSTVELEAALREMKRALGCGAVRDGNDVVLQGAPGERLVAFLEAHGARKVVVGS
jgi:translation initiation factor 1 (eIF-1/SUI1)